MTVQTGSLNRRNLLFGATALLGESLLGKTFLNHSSRQLLAQATTPPAGTCNVASAGSFGPILRGPARDAAAERLGLDLRSESQGADAVAASLVDGSRHADVFVSITPGPMRSVLQAGKAALARPIAQTEMVLIYSPKSPLAPRFAGASPNSGDWLRILQEPGLRFARSNPAADPGGRNVIFTLMLAALKYQQPELVQKVLGPTFNDKQIVPGANNQALLKSGDLDAMISYKVGPAFAGLPYILLPNDVNLSGPDVHSTHPDLHLTLTDSTHPEKTFYPEPLVFYAAVLEGAANQPGALAFVDFLAGPDGQALLRKYDSDPAQGAPVLHK